jgi:hypothetical protein
MLKALVNWTLHQETCFLIEGRTSKDLLDKLHDLRASELATAPTANFQQDGSVDTTASTFRIVEVFREH